MRPDLFSLLADMKAKKPSKQQSFDDVYQHINRLRSEQVVVGHRVPAYFEQLSDGELDDVITTIWFEAGFASVNHQILLELDVLGAALGFPGCQTRLLEHVQDAMADLGLTNPWASRGTSNL